jgi:hypothetical protein
MKNLTSILFITALFCFSNYCRSEDKKAKSLWDELQFGVGVSFTKDLGDNSRIKSAEVVDGIVRVSDEENGFPRFVVESHYFFSNEGTFGHGLFVTAEPGGGEIINAIGIGYMVGFREDTNSTRSWNIGLAYVADPNTQILGEGIKANEPLPGNETVVRFKEETQYGLMLVFSASW